MSPPLTAPEARVPMQSAAISALEGAWGSGAQAKWQHGDQHDSQLLLLVRAGDQAAFAELYRRHLAGAGRVARAQSDNSSDSEDIVAEAFATVLKSISLGGGPREYFQAYLTTTVRRIAHRRNVRARRAAALGYRNVVDVLVLDEDATIKAFESTILMRAFRSLPIRWQAVLWCVEVEGLKPAATGRVMELTPNGVSSLLIRAREGLRQAYLQEHVPQVPNDACTDISRHLGKFVRNAVRKAARQRVDQHVATCARCAAALNELREIQAAMNDAGRVLK